MDNYMFNSGRSAAWLIAAIVILIWPTIALSSAINQGQTLTQINTQQSSSQSEHFYCPMHPEVTSDKEGRCPKCNMFLVKDDAHEHVDDSSNDHFYCPMHPEVTSDQEGRCPKCNMFLVKDDAHEHVDDSSHDHNQFDQVISQAVAPLDDVINPQSSPTASTSESKVKYVCPMHPHVVSDTPSTCPICGMNLEKVTVGGNENGIEVNVSGSMQQALGIRSLPAERGTLWKFVNTIGSVAYNENTIGHVHTRVTGWIETLLVHNVGQKVQKGQLLYALYSPELINAQDDYSQAIDYLKQDKNRGQILLKKARQRLSLLGVSDATIKQLETTGETVYRIPFYAEQDGFVSELNVRHGMYVQPGDTLIEIVDQSSVWVIAEVFENEQSWLEEGRPVEVSATAQGLFDIESTIDYIYPELDPVTRAMQVRIQLDNHNKLLKPGSLVDVKLFGGPKRDVIWVPTEALIQTGRENRVVLKLDDNRFSSVEVKIGMISQGKAEVLEGINQGDNVIVSGQFLIDSEASIQGSLQRLSQPEANSHQHNH